MLWVRVICILLCVGQMMQEPTCKPTLSEGRTGKPEIGGFIFFECEISSCRNMTKIVFEKTGFNATWTPIFEGINNTYSKAFDAFPGYTLQNRHDYYAFRNIVTLNIDRLILQDHGQWKCVGHDATLGQHESEPLDFNIYVPPADGNFFIKPNHSHLVIGQQREFTCFSHGIHPEPDMFWKVNGIENKGKSVKTQSADQLWTVMNTIKLQFDTVGVKNLTCAVEAKARDLWFWDHINITVKEKAVVLYPLHDLTQNVDVDANFTLRCSVSGYNPRITWGHNGHNCLINDTRYIIRDDCDTIKCESFITSKSMDLALACDDKEEYSGVYTCVVSLEPPYISTATSSNMNVTILKSQCNGTSIGLTFGLPMLSVVCVAFIAFVIGCLVYQNIKRKRQGNRDAELQALLENSTSPDIEFYKEMEEQQVITPTYETATLLKQCVRKPGDDHSDNHLVLFDFKTNYVIMHDVSDLTQFTVYKCDINILDMIRTSHDRFVMTEFKTRDIHLLHVIDGKFQKLNTISRDSDNWRPLICADTDTSFIWCDFSGHEPYDIKIYRVDVTIDKLVPHDIATVTVNAKPSYISLSADSKRLVMVTDGGTLYIVNMYTFEVTTDYTVAHKSVDSWVRSLYIDQRDNIIIGNGSQITVYTHDKHRYVVPRVGDHIHGVTVNNGRIIVNCGLIGKRQSIKVYKPKNSTLLPHVEIITSSDIDFYKNMELHKVITPTYQTAKLLKHCVRKQSDDKLALFDFQHDRVFMHDMSDLNQYMVHKCDMNIYDMIRASHDRFVVTEYIKRHIHLLQLTDGKFQTLDTRTQNSQDWRPLICTDTDSSFIWCDLLGHEPYDIKISRVDITNDQLVPHEIATVNVDKKPTYISLSADRKRLVMVNDLATLYIVDLHSHAVTTDNNMENKAVDCWVRSLYIDQRDNIIIGDGSQINVYTHDKQRYVVPSVGERIRGVTVNNEWIIVNCGIDGKKQYIKVYKKE